MRRRKLTLKLSAEDLQQVFVSNGHRLLNESGLKTDAQKVEWLEQSLGMIMESHELSGTIKANRTPIPDGYMLKPVIFDC